MPVLAMLQISLIFKRWYIESDPRVALLLLWNRCDIARSSPASTYTAGASACSVMETIRHQFADTDTRWLLCMTIEILGPRLILSLSCRVSSSAGRTSTYCTSGVQSADQHH
jgi:hypothetical protein